MHKIPVVFEDAGWRGLRPLADSTPCFELRCGLFNLRERITLTRKRLLAPAGADTPPDGCLLMRPVLRALNTASSWRLELDETIDVGGDESRYVWLNGRLGSCTALLDLVLAPGAPTREFALFRGEALVAASVSHQRQQHLRAFWSTWSEDAICSGATVFGADFCSDLDSADLADNWRLLGGDTDLQARLTEIVNTSGDLFFDWIWQLVPATATAISRDLALCQTVGSYTREPFGLFFESETATPPWSERTALQTADALTDASLGLGALVTDRSELWLGRNVEIAPGTVIDTGPGPVILDNGVTVMPHSYLQGPLYVGPGSTIKAGAKIYGETSFGIGCRVTGEIGESTFGDFTNKQHDGFIGHAVLGSWVNLGALTTNSDLKNNYGKVRVDLGDGTIETGLHFVGLLAGDHVKTAIGTMLNTGTVVGFASNIFGGMPPKYVGAFSWGGQTGAPSYGLERAMDTARVVLGRRACRFTEGHAALFAGLAG